MESWHHCSLACSVFAPHEQLSKKKLPSIASQGACICPMHVQTRTP